MTPSRIHSGKPLRIRAFNQHQLNSDEIRKTFVARQKLFESIVRDISAHKSNSVPQHHLVVGQRGMGKSLLLQRIAVELLVKPLRQEFLPMTFPEEQYVEVDRLSKFWLNCLDSAADALERENNNATVLEIEATVRELEKLDTDEVTFGEQCFDAFRDLWKKLNRRPVLLIDNFNMLLARLRDSDNVLRGHFTKRGGPILVAASTIYPERTEDYGAAFYDGFKPHILNPLSLEEISEVFRNLAVAVDRPELTNRIHQEMPRLAALRDLTGGNPRTALLLFNLFADGFSEDAYEDLDALLDIVTPLYQSRLDHLSEQTQTIVGTLARNWAPMTKAGIAKAARVNASSVPSQLGRLREIGIVEETPIFPGKKTGYQIAERFFNIWYLMRFTTRRQRSSLASLARFLEEYHTPKERMRSARELMGRESFSRGNIRYAMALAQSIDGQPESVELERRAQLELIEQMSGVRSKIAELLDPDEIEPQVFEFAELKQKLTAAVPPDSPIEPKKFVALVLSSPSMIPGGKGDAVQVDRNALAGSKLSGSDVKRIAEQLQAEQNKLENPFDKATVAWLGERLRNNILNSWANGQDVMRLVEAASTKSQASIIRKCAANSAIRTLSNAAFEKFVGLLELRPDETSEADKWFNWGYDLDQEFSRYSDAWAAYREAIRINPDHKQAWNNLGNLLQLHLGRYVESEAAYREAIRINSDNAIAWSNLGNLLQLHLERYVESEAAYREAIRIKPDHTNAWDGLGNLFTDYLNQLEEAIVCYRRALECDTADDSPRHNLVFLLRDRQNDRQAALELLGELRDPENECDTQHLHRALFAAYDDNWGLAADEIRAALAETNGRLPSRTRDDWFRSSAVLLHLGFGEKLVALLKQEGTDVTLMPWFAAVEAHQVGDRRQLGNIPLEARPAAEEIYDEIELRRKQLPDKTRRK